MLGILASIFGSSDVIKKGMDLIDDIHTSTEEEIKAKADAKVSLMKSYEPFKVAQRYIAIMFTFVFIFIMLNGVLGSLYGVVDMDSVERAKEFANSMWLGEIMMGIISFYFGGGMINSLKGNNGKS